MIAPLARRLATLVLAVLVGLGLVGALADTAHAAAQPGPTQVINDPHSARTLALKDNAGKKFTVRHGDYVLHTTDRQFFTTFYVPKGTYAKIFATDPYGRTISGRLQQEKKAGWHHTNAKVDAADLVVIKIYKIKKKHSTTKH